MDLGAHVGAGRLVLQKRSEGSSRRRAAIGGSNGCDRYRIQDNGDLPGRLCMILVQAASEGVDVFHNAGIDLGSRAISHTWTGARSRQTRMARHRAAPPAIRAVTVGVSDTICSSGVPRDFLPARLQQPVQSISVRTSSATITPVEPARRLVLRTAGPVPPTARPSLTAVNSIASGFSS